MLIPDQIMPDGQPAPGSVIPKADVHIIELTGSELWMDVKIPTVAPDLAIAKELLREEQTKCRAHGQRNGYNLQALEKGMTPIVLEQYDRIAPWGTSHFQQDHSPSPASLSDRDCPSHTPRGSPAQSVGPHLLRTAPSSLAGARGVHAEIRPGRSWGHTA